MRKGLERETAIKNRRVNLKKIILRTVVTAGIIGAVAKKTSERIY